MSKILITITGPDRPGITETMMDIVLNSGHTLCDIGQAVTHNMLSLSFALESEEGHERVLKELLFAADRNHLRLDYRELANASGPTGDIFILTCVSPKKLTAAFIRDLARVLCRQSINIRRIDNLTPKGFHSLEMLTALPAGADSKTLKGELVALGSAHAVDMAFLKDDIHRRNKRLVAFDMDSTLIQGEMIDKLASLAGAGQTVRQITGQAMRGEIPFEQALRRRVAALAGLPVKDLGGLLDEVPLTPGCAPFVRTLKNLGYKTALISGGFGVFANRLKERLGLDYAFANELEERDGKLTGKLSGTIIDGPRKAALLRKIADQEGIALAQTVAIGDGANDLPMLNSAGLGIAYCAKEAVRRQAPQRLEHGPLTSILYFLGASPGT